MGYMSKKSISVRIAKQQHLQFEKQNEKLHYCFFVNLVKNTFPSIQTGLIQKQY
jgi:hypothetical protein